MDNDKEKELEEAVEHPAGGEIIEAPKGAEPEDAINKSRMELYDWLQCIVSAVLCGILIFVFIGRVIGVDGTSMFDTLHHNDKVFMTNVFYKPKNGDIVIFHSDAYGDTPLVKRVIAVAGQEIDINFEKSEVSVDGVVLHEDYIYEPTRESLGFSGPVTVPEGYIFVMGDNRNASNDSRGKAVGFVDTRNILGKVHFITIPGNTDFEPRDWSRIGSVY